MKNDTTKFINTEVEFRVDNKDIKFNIIHNLPDVQGLSFEAALHNWLTRTEEYTAESLVEYILSKNTGHIAMTEEDFNSTYNI